MILPKKATIQLFKFYTWNTIHFQWVVQEVWKIVSNNIVLFIITLLVLSENAKQLHTAHKSSKIIESDLKTACSNLSMLVCVLFGGVGLVLSLLVSWLVFLVCVLVCDSSRLSHCLLPLCVVFLVCLLFCNCFWFSCTLMDLSLEFSSEHLRLSSV